jgi:hypothetical protein
MTMRIWILATLVAPASISASAQPQDATAAQAASVPVAAATIAQPSSTRANAVIEDVIEAVDDGYRFNAYVVRWHGVRVVVSDPTSQGHLAVGDTLHFIAGHSDVIKGQRMLSFISTEHDANSSDHAGLSAASSAVQSETSTVEEVLTAQEDGYQFTAYIIRWQGKRVAVIDMQSSPPQAVGDQIDLVVMRMAPMGRKVLGFLKPPINVGQAAAHTQDTGIVEEVLRGRVDGDAYADYIVRWRGFEVAVSASTSWPSTGATAQPANVGEGIPLTISRTKLPSSAGILHFVAGTPGDTAISQVWPKDLSMVVTNAKGTVERVLTAQADDYHYRAYIVIWHGTQVAVDDAFSSTHFKVGDQVAFTVARTGATGNGQLMFTLFDFPRAQGSNGRKPPTASTQ